MSDSLLLLGKIVGGIEGGGVLNNRYMDWVNLKPQEPASTETAEEIVARFASQLGVKQK